jgi:hypothetical protein
MPLGVLCLKDNDNTFFLKSLPCRVSKRCHGGDLLDDDHVLTRRTHQKRRDTPLTVVMYIEMQ